MCGGECLNCKVGDPIMEIVVTRLDEAALIRVKRMVDGELCSTAVAMVRKVRDINAVIKEEGIPPFLRP